MEESDVPVVAIILGKWVRLTIGVCVTAVLSVSLGSKSNERGRMPHTHYNCRLSNRSRASVQDCWLLNIHAAGTGGDLTYFTTSTLLGFVEVDSALRSRSSSK